ncbi:MAG: arginyltransferase [Alphaproteobacteria bacterium]
MNSNFDFSKTAFYSSIEGPCPYLNGVFEKKILTELKGENAVVIYNILSRYGFRRSYNLCYTQVCDNCSNCIPIRVKVDDFKLTRSFKRVISKNQNIKSFFKYPKASQEQFLIFQKYQNQRHQDGEMSQMDFEEYRSMMEESPIDTQVLELRTSKNKLYALGICDILEDGLSAVYLFFDPSYEQQSPGTFTILNMIEQTKKLGLKYLYLGFWVPKSDKMSYKSRFKPLEILTPLGWLDLEDV